MLKKNDTDMQGEIEVRGEWIQRREGNGQGTA